MKIFIDCEFNGGNGALISMGLVDENGREFYEVLDCENPVPWVAENVMPILGKKPIPLLELQNRLWLYLSYYDKVHLIADHPADLGYFFNTVILDNMGKWLTLPPTSAELRPEIEYTSRIPHNALEDAKAIRVAALPH